MAMVRKMGKTCHCCTMAVNLKDDIPVDDVRNCIHLIGSGGYREYFRGLFIASLPLGIASIRERRLDAGELMEWKSCSRG